MLAVSVHIVTFNNQSTIAECIKSVKNQSYKNWKLLIIDNNSTDQTIKLATKVLKQLRLKCQIIHNTQNIGYAAAHNKAISLTKSKYILTLNPDVSLDRNFLSELLKTMDRGGQKVGSAAGLLTRVRSLTDKPSLIDGAGFFMRRNRRQALRHELQPLTAAETRPTPIFGPDGAAAFYKRAMVEDVKINGEFFDEDFFMHKEDADVCWRAQLRGWTSLFVPTATAKHIRTFHPGQRKNMPKFIKMIAVRNRYLMMIKNEIPALFLRDILRILFYDLGILLYILCKEQSSLAAYGQIIRMLNTMLKKRRQIQNTIKVAPNYISQWFE